MRKYLEEGRELTILHELVSVTLINLCSKLEVLTGEVVRGV